MTQDRIEIAKIHCKLWKIVKRTLIENSSSVKYCWNGAYASWSLSYLCCLVDQSSNLRLLLMQFLVSHHSPCQAQFIRQLLLLPSFIELPFTLTSVDLRHVGILCLSHHHLSFLLQFWLFSNYLVQTGGYLRRCRRYGVHPLNKEHGHQEEFLSLLSWSKTTEKIFSHI